MASSANFFPSFVAACVISLALALKDVRLHKNGDTLGDSEMCPVNTNLSVTVFQTPVGEWLTTFSANKKLGNLTREVNFDLTTKVLQCGDSRCLFIGGILKDGSMKNVTDKTYADEQPKNNRIIATEEFKLMKDKLRHVEENISQELKVIRERLTGFEEDITPPLKILTLAMTALDIYVNTIAEKLEEFEKRFIRIEENLLSKATCKNELRFHPEYKLKKISLNYDFRTAIRNKPRESAFFGGVITEKSLCEDEVFKFRIDKTLDVWTDYGLVIGLIRDPAPYNTSMHWLNELEGTWTLITFSDQSTGYSSTRKDKSTTASNYPLDLRGLPVGTVLGIVRRKNGNVHFFKDGLDKGVAFRNVPADVHGFVDVSQYVTQISIVD